MPLCVHCAHILPHLYTIYQSAHNTRLEQCPSCHLFADPYVEHDNLIVLLDLILFKRAVYRHLLFNRGSPPRRAAATSAKQLEDLESSATRSYSASWLLTLRVGFAVVLVDAFIRWTELRSKAGLQSDAWTTWDVKIFVRIFLGCLVETTAFHAGITVASFLVLAIVDRITAWRENSSGASSHSNIRKLHRYSHIPLCLLYSSVTKFFLLFLLAIWDLDRPAPSSQPEITPAYMYTIQLDSPLFRTVWESLDDDKIDRQWVVRNVLGGMSAGFGLRVVLDCHPSLSTLVIFTGWAVKSAVANVVSGFVDQDIAEAWLAYSLP